MSFRFYYTGHSYFLRHLGFYSNSLFTCLHFIDCHFFSAVYLSYKRSPYFALAYGLNDLVLILLWMHAAQTDSSQYAVVICFATFLINDSYTFYNWLMLQRYQEKRSKRMRA